MACLICKPKSVQQVIKYHWNDMCWEYSCICSFVHLFNQHLLSIYNEEGILADLGKNAIAAQQKMVKSQHKK